MSKIIQLKPKTVQQNKLRIGLVIQARMTSNRFPGKTMAPILGKPILEWVIERTKQIRGQKGNKPTVVVAVPDTVESEPMLVLADKLGITNFCGAELNVLKRYYDCARLFKFDVIGRITADCPFLDPRVCSEVLQLLLWRKLDYACNCYPERTYPKGLDFECMTFDALEAAFKMVESPYDLEHVTPWLQRTEGVIKGNVKQKDNKSSLNWCVDYPEDIARLEKEITDNVIHLIGAND